MWPIKEKKNRQLLLKWPNLICHIESQMWPIKEKENRQLLI